MAQNATPVVVAGDGRSRQNVRPTPRVAETRTLHVQNQRIHTGTCSYSNGGDTLYITHKQFIVMQIFCVVTMSETVCCHLSPEPSRESLSTVLFDALAEARGVEPSELDLCVYHYVDPSALDGLFDSSTPGISREGTISFPVDSCQVTIDVATDGSAEVRVTSDATASEDASNPAVASANSP
jgi:hypothetical protein